MSNFPDADEMHELREMLKELCDLDEGLSAWEIEFIDNMCDWEGSFTEAQATKIEDLYEKRIY